METSKDWSNTRNVDLSEIVEKALKNYLTSGKYE
jgi:hypothetical protein